MNGGIELASFSAGVGRGRVRSRQFLAERDREWERQFGGSFLAMRSASGRYSGYEKRMRILGAAFQAWASSDHQAARIA